MCIAELLNTIRQVLPLSLTQRPLVFQCRAFDIQLFLQLIAQPVAQLVEFLAIAIEVRLTPLNPRQQILSLRDPLDKFPLSSLQLTLTLGEFFLGLLLLQSEAPLVLIECRQLIGQVRFPPLQLAHSFLEA